MCNLIDSHLEDHIEIRTILFNEHLHDFNRHECMHGISGHSLVNWNSLDCFNMKWYHNSGVFEIRGLPS